MTRTVGIFCNLEKVKAKAAADKLKKWLKRKGLRSVVVPPMAKSAPDMDFAITLGGDGTMLKASRIFAPRGIPVLGVNLGTLGFLAETNPAETTAFLTRIITEGFHTEERTMLAVTVTTAGRNRTRSVTRTALNECIIHSGSHGRVVSVNASLNGEFLADYVGDGLIVGTPTGSTAYSLAASGPIVHPHLNVFVITPICPHTLTQRPLIISSKHTVTLQTRSPRNVERPVLSIDGQTSMRLGKNDIVSVTASTDPLRLIVNPERKYLEVLRAKLKWGERG